MGATFQIGWYDPPLPMTASQLEKETAPLMSAASFEISDSTLYHEIVRARVDWTGDPLPSATPVTFKWYNSDTGVNIFNFNYTWEAGWNWAWACSWMGHLPAGEIDKAGNYRVEISAPGLFSKTLNFVITEVVPPEPTHYWIKGYVRDVVTGEGIVGATVNIAGISDDTDHIGYYGMIDVPAGTQTAVIFAAGYKGLTQSVNILGTQDQNIDFVLEAETVVPEYRVLPEPPPGWTTAQIELYKRLDEACAEKDKVGILDVLRDMFEVEMSPLAFAAVVLAISKVATIIVSILGSIAFAAFLYEETLQTIDMCIWTASSKKEWDLAAKCLAKKKEILDVTWVEKIISYIPLVNVVAAVNKFVEASTVKMEVDEELISREQALYGTPVPGDFEGYVASIDAGAPDPTKLPNPTGLIINSVPSGAGVEIAEIPVTFIPTPLKIIPIDPGAYTVTVSMAGYVSQTTIVNVPEGWTVTEDYYLKSEVPPPEMEIAVTSSPTGASIFIDGTLQRFPTNTVITPAMPGSYRVRVEKTGYETQEKIVTIAEGEKKAVHFDLVAIVVPPEKGTLDARSTPTGANVILEGVSIGITPFTYELDPGLYELKFAKTGYIAETKTILIKAGEISVLSVILTPTPEPEPEKGNITVKSVPTGAKIFMDDVDTGKFTDWTFYNLLPTAYQIRVEKTGYITQEKRLTIGAGEHRTTTFTLVEEVPPTPPPGKGILSVRSTPTGAEVSIAGVVKGVTPLDLDLEPGTYDVVLTLVDYKDELKTVTIYADQTYVLDVLMTAEIEVVLPKYGSIEVITDPDKADIFINGALYEWKSNTVIGDLNPGTFLIKVHKTGYIDQEKSIVVEEDLRSTASFTLVPEEVVIPPKKGHLVIEVAPDYVELILAGTSLGTLPPPGRYETDLDPGSYDFTFRKDGYYSTTRTAIIRDGETTYLSVSLIKVPVTQRLWRVDVSAVDTAGLPLSAKILVNGAFTGKWTPDYVLLNPGEYVFMITKAGYIPAEVPLTLEPI